MRVIDVLMLMRWVCFIMWGIITGKKKKVDVLQSPRNQKEAPDDKKQEGQTMMMVRF